MTDNSYLSNLLIKVFFVLLLSVTEASTSVASESKLLFIKSGAAPVYDSIINATRQRITHLGKSKMKDRVNPSIEIASIDNENKLFNLIRNDNWDLIITIGTNAARWINGQYTSSPILYTLIPSHSYSDIRKNSINVNTSAIYIDQPITRQLQLIKSAIPGKNKVGVLLGNYSGISKQKLQSIMLNMGLKPVIINVGNNKLGPVLEKIYSKSDALLAQPDPSIYNKNTVMQVLLSSYRHNVPVFGYSAAFARSGAAASIYSSPTDIGKHMGEEIDKYLYSNKQLLPPPDFPRYFSIYTNRSVIRSLNITIPSTNTIKSRILKAQ